MLNHTLSYSQLSNYLKCVVENPLSETKKAEMCWSRCHGGCTYTGPKSTY